MRKNILWIILIAFSIQSTWVLVNVGYMEIWRYALASLAGQQVLADLTIALTLVMTWIWHDAKANNRRFWPWFVFALAAGSFSPLLYLLTKPRQATRQAHS